MYRELRQQIAESNQHKEELKEKEKGCIQELVGLQEEEKKRDQQESVQQNNVKGNPKTAKKI